MPLRGVELMSNVNKLSKNCHNDPIVVTEEMKTIAIGMAIDGRTIKEIAVKLGMSSAQFWKSRQQSPEWGIVFAQAREEGINNMVDKLDNIHETYHDVNRSRLASDNIKWKASKINARVYGDKLDVNINQTVDIGGALADARKRADALTHDVTPQIEGDDVIDIEPITDEIDIFK